MTKVVSRLILSASLLAGSAFAVEPAVEAAKAGTKVAVQKTKSSTLTAYRAVRNSISGDKIKTAREAGLVWADHDTWTYVKDGDTYGKTPTGEFWTEDHAKSAGYSLAEPKAVQ